jgi:HEAT repeat protein
MMFSIAGLFVMLIWVLGAGQAPSAAPSPPDLPGRETRAARIARLVAALGPAPGWGGECGNAYVGPVGNAWRELTEIGPPAVPALMAVLDDASVWRRMLAAHALGIIGDRRATVRLIRRLRGDPDATVQCYAAEALGKLRDPRAFGPLLDAARSGPLRSSSRIAWALGRFRDRRAVPVLVPMLRGRVGGIYAGGAYENGTAAAWALARIGRASIPSLLLALRSRAPSVRMNAALGLADLRTRRAVPCLVRMLCDEPAVATVAARALSRIGDRRAVRPLRPLLTAKDRELRCAAAVALGDLGDARAVPALAGLLEQDDFENGPDCLRALASTRDRRALDAILHFIAVGSPSSLARLAPDIGAAIGRIGDRRAAGPLLRALDRGKGQRAAIHGLATLRERRAVDPLLRLLDTAGYDLRPELAAALGQIGDRRAAPKVRLLLRDRHAAWPAEVAGALGRIGSREDVGPLIALLSDGSWGVRAKAAEALGRLGTREAIAPLCRLAQTYEPGPMFAMETVPVRRVALDAIARINDRTLP